MKQKTARRCETCGQKFRPMTEAQWRHIRMEHELMSLRHPEALREEFRTKLLAGVQTA